jgi:hypothetical protein
MHFVRAKPSTALDRPPAGFNLKAGIEIRTLHQKMDLLQEQFKKLVETQAGQIRLLQKISEKQ